MSRSLCSIAMDIWHLCIAHNIHPIALHVPGVDNTQADSLSRDYSPNHEWSINSIYLDQIFLEWGTPAIDVFATPNNAKCPLYCTRGGRDPLSLGDGLLYDWNKDFLYMFPPIPLLPKILRRLQQQRATTILIAPWWPRRDWFPLLLELSGGQYIRLPQEPDLLSLTTEQILHHDIPSLSLTAWRIDLADSHAE